VSAPRGIAILGSTGSVGRSTLAVAALHPEKFRVTVLGAHKSWQVVVEQAQRFSPDVVVLMDPEAAARAREALRACASKTTVECGAAALAAAVTGANVQMVMAAIVGAAGLQPTLAAVRAAKRVLLANKESLVMAGRLLMDEVRSAGAELIPIDSEHNAIFQCMPAGYLPGVAARGVTRVILTASGGPFRCADSTQIEHATPDQACNHPKWKMGRKISVDSATLMNKGLEVIEATLLFELPESQVDVVVHGRHSHEQQPRSDLRRRLILTRRVAALAMATVMFTAQTKGAPDPGSPAAGANGNVRPVSADEIWDFVAHGVTG